MPGGEGGPGRRDALIIAAGRFQDPGLGVLRSPSQDAAELAGVLGDWAIGGFDARVLLNEPGQLLREEIDGFFADRRPEDVLVLYLSCHGVKAVAGQLHFAVSTTKLGRLASTSIPAGFVYEQADRCRARKILLLLDCCYSGVYLKGHRPKAEGRAGIKALDGRGRAVITSCTALEYGLEIDTGRVTGTAAPSVFTAALVEGLRTGRADRDGDGLVSVDELYAYVFDRVRETTPHQTPEKKWGDVRGEFIIARNPRPAARPAQPVPPVTPAGTAGHARQHVTTRRVLLGLATASAAGLAVTGWGLSHHTAAARPPRPKSTPAATPLWNRSLGKFPRVLWGPPVVTGGAVYAGDGGSLYALRASNGDRILTVSADTSLGLAMSDGDIFTWSKTSRYNRYNHPFAFRASDGRKIWYSPLGLMPGETSGPVIARGVVYIVGRYGEVHALRQSDGARIWSSRSSVGIPGGITAVGNTIYVAGISPHSNVCAMRVSDGANIWSFPTSQGTFRGLVVAGDIVYVASRNGMIYALRASDGTKLWSFHTGKYSGPISLVDSVLYVGSSHSIYALRASDGTKLWSYPSGKVIELLVARGAVYITDDYGVMRALRASDGTRIWSFPIDNEIAAIASAAGTVYVASNNLYALRASDGTMLWSFPIEVQNGGMVIASNVLYVTSTVGLYAFRV